MSLLHTQTTPPAEIPTVHPSPVHRPLRSSRPITALLPVKPHQTNMEVRTWSDLQTQASRSSESDQWWGQRSSRDANRSLNVGRPSPSVQGQLGGCGGQRVMAGRRQTWKTLFLLSLLSFSAELEVRDEEWEELGPDLAALHRLRNLPEHMFHERLQESALQSVTGDRRDREGTDNL
ncbi:unnamed protein product [Pleuronectes platessa]|uniref:Uncharacterized protein n=1 Tax=Pleuronectes platessa TaxID=8262 RepID=A0A9N7YKM5_PLEPL|nr:unnamed protein product [Pleuronectes platessa]